MEAILLLHATLSTDPDVSLNNSMMKTNIFNLSNTPTPTQGSG